MGLGDQIIGTGLARGAFDRGKRIAFGDGRIIKWDQNSPLLFRGNPNIAPPGSEKDKDIEWINFYKGSRLYSKGGQGRWIFNYDFKVKPGEFFFGKNEDVPIEDDGMNLILIEPNVPRKPCAPNKQWPLDYWNKVVAELTLAGFTVKQFQYGGPNQVAPGIETLNIRAAAALMKHAKLAILHEGGLHHSAAAVGCPAIVLFGGFVPSSVLGYRDHINLTGGAEACGTFNKCQHCIDAMKRIDPEEVLAACERILYNE